MTELLAFALAAGLWLLWGVAVGHILIKFGALDPSDDLDNNTLGAMAVMGPLSTVILLVLAWGALAKRIYKSRRT